MVLYTTLWCKIAVPSKNTVSAKKHNRYFP